jgi:hypothetical protein
MSFSPRAGAVISFTVEGAQTAQRQIETVGSSFNQLSTVARTGLAALAAGYAALNIGAYVKDATLLAARYETLGVVMHTAGVNAGYSNAQMDSYAGGLEKSGISMMKAREAMVAMTAANLDNNKALELGRMAQNLAAISNKSSSETLTDLIMNIQQADTEELKHMGIILNQEEALQKYATAHNTVTKALTQTQKSEAIQAAVMQEGAKYAGIYEKAMGTAGKALSSLDRYFENIKVRLGTPFLEGFAQGVFGVTDGVKQLNKRLEELEKNGAMEKVAKSIGSTVGLVISAIKETVEIAGQFASGIVAVGQVAAVFFNQYLGGMATVKAVTIAFAVLLSGYLVEQAVIGFNAVSAAAIAAATKVGAAFLAMGAAATNFFRALQLSAALTGWGATILLGARMLVTGLVATVASIPGAVGAAVVAAGLAVGYVFAKAFGDQLEKLMPKFIDDAVNKGMAWVVSKTSNLPEVSEAVDRGKPEDAAKAAANKAEKDRKEQLMREMNNAVVAAEAQIAVTSAANTRLKALNELRDQQLKQSLDQRIIAQADYLQKKEKMDVAEAQGQLAQIAAQKAQLAAYMAAFKAGAPLGQGRDPAADANEMIKLSGEEAAAQAKLNAVKQSYAYQIAGAVIESYTKEFGSIASIVDAQEQLVLATRRGLLEAGKTAEQRETLGALRMESAADELSAELAAKQANGIATKEYIQNTSAMIAALTQMGQARLKAVGTNVAVSFVNDTKAMRDDTVAMYADMRNTFIGTEEERVRAAADASIRLAEIRKQDAYAAIDGTNDSDAQKIAAKQKVLQAYNDYVKAMNENADAKALQSSKGFETLRDAIGSAFDVNKIESFGQAMSTTFGNAGAALGSLIDSFTLYDQQQRDNEAARQVASIQYKNDADKLAAAQSAITMKQQREQLGYYANVAGAAKGFFKENTAGYKVMQGAEKAFRAYEMAMAVSSMVQKSGLLTAFTGLFVASKATQTAAEGTATGASVAMAGTQATAWGVTAVIKAIASMPYPMNLVAGAVTLAAVVALGAAVAGSLGGGGSAAVNMNSAEERQKVQGTGTVLGDSTAKSESIANSLEIMQKNSDLELDYQNSMLSALQNIASALGGAAKGILQTTGITGGSAFGTVASSDKAFIGASHTKDITDSGVQFSGTFGQLRSGTGTGRQYEDVYTTSDGGMFRSGWSRTDTNYKALSAEAMKPFSLIFDNMGDLLVDAGSKLGRDSTSLTNAINNISVDFAVSLRGLTGQDLTDALNAGVSVAFDKVTTQLFPTIQQFQKMGEGLGETLVRVASDVQGVDSVFTSMGKSLAGMSLEAKENLVEAAGGLEKFASSAKSFMQNFYSEDEQRAAAKAKLNPILAQYGLTTEGADAQKIFRDYIVGLDTSVAAQAEAYTALMSLQQAFFDATDAAASQRKDLQDQWDELTMTSAQLQEKALQAYDPSNRALAKQVALQRELKESTESASDALKSTVERLSATKDSALAYNNSLLLGTLSTLTPMQKYVETQRQYSAAIDKANLAPSDSTAVSAAQAAATAFLTASQVVNASSSAYLGDKSKVLSDMNELAAIAGVQMTDAQKQLSALDKQVAGIAQLNDTAAAIQAAIVDQGAPAPIAVPTFDAQRYAAGSGAGTEVLASEVKALREENAAAREVLAAALDELKKLRADANRNADKQLDATEEAGDAVAEAVGGAMEQAAYLARNPTRVPTR